MSEATLLERLRALEQGATPGPWRFGYPEYDGGSRHMIVDGTGYVFGQSDDAGNGLLIEGLRNALPEIIEALERGALGARLLGAVEAGWVIANPYGDEPMWGACGGAMRIFYYPDLPTLLDAIEATEQGAGEERNG